jgi:hypothetical protein
MSILSIYTKRIIPQNFNKFIYILKMGQVATPATPATNLDVSDFAKNQTRKTGIMTKRKSHKKE